MFYRPIDEHLALRLFSPFDAEEAYALIDANRERLGEFLVWVSGVTSVEDERQHLSDNAYDPDRKIKTFLTLDGAIIGAVGLIRINRVVRWAEIGYWIGAGYEGRGYVTAAVRELEKMCFTELGMQRVQIRNDVDNLRSRAVPERLGYNLDGVLRRHALSGDGRIVDYSMYSLLREEWEAREGH